MKLKALSFSVDYQDFYSIALVQNFL